MNKIIKLGVLVILLNIPVNYGAAMQGEEEDQLKRNLFITIQFKPESPMALRLQSLALKHIENLERDKEVSYFLARYALKSLKPLPYVKNFYSGEFSLNPQEIAAVPGENPLKPEETLDFSKKSLRNSVFEDGSSSGLETTSGTAEEIVTRLKSDPNVDIAYEDKICPMSTY